MCVKAYEQRKNETLFEQWLSDKHHLKEEYRWNFEEYKALFKPKKQMTEEERTEMKKRIDIETERIRKKFNGGGE